MSKNAELAIGVFDSGLGGLTVLKSLRARFPHENFVYLGDTARIPYGTKSSRTIAKYLEQNLRFLLEQKVKAVVIACNSASSVMEFVKSPVPLYGVIAPGSRLASQLTTNGQIGIIATKATVASKSYATHIEKIASHFKVYQQACPLLVPLVEEGWDDDPITNLIVYRYLSPLLAVGIDTLILGCTHYPILKKTIRKVVGFNVQLIESGDAIGEQIHLDLQNNILPANHTGAAAQIRFLSTDTSETFQAQAQRIMAPDLVQQFELVDIN